MNNRSRQGFYTIWTAAILLSVLAALVSVFVVSCSRVPEELRAAQETETAEEILPEDGAESETEDADIPQPESTPEPTAVPAPVELALSEDQGEAYLDDFVFLGDSTTYGLAAYEVLPFTQVWTNASGTLTLSDQSAVYIDYYSDDGSIQQMQIANAAARGQPKYLVITLGLNGISFMSEEEFKEQYIDLINTILRESPDTKIICHSIYPVIDSQVSSDIGNDRINTANEWIRQIAEETGTRYLNTHDTLMDEGGNLRAEYCNGDGIHLSPAGGQAVLISIRTHAYQ